MTQLNRIPSFAIPLGIAVCVVTAAWVYWPGERDEEVVRQAAAIEAEASTLLSGEARSVDQGRSAVGAAKRTAPPSSGLPETQLHAWSLETAKRQGYGNYVSNALGSGDAQALFSAAKVINGCRHVALEVTSDRATFMRDGDLVARTNLDESEQQERRCQSLTPDQVRGRLSMLQRAAEGGVMGAASTYYHEAYIVDRLDVSAMEWLKATLARDAELGDAPAMKPLACDRIGDSLVPAQRALYQAVLKAAAERSRISSHVQMLVGYCETPFVQRDAADPARVAALLQRIDTVGTDYRR